MLTGASAAIAIPGIATGAAATNVFEACVSNLENTFHAIDTPIT
jgi:hypothetical protein